MDRNEDVWLQTQSNQFVYDFTSYRPVSLCFDLQKIATEFILRLILSFNIDKYYLKTLEKSKHGTWENNKTVL